MAASRNPVFFSCHPAGNGLRLHCLLRDGRLLHSTFSRESHEEAIALLSRTFSSPPPVHIEVPDLLRPLVDVLQGGPIDLQIAVDPFFLQRGTVLQQKVWTLLAAIPFGTTQTYGELAQQLGNPRLARAVGQACAHNPLALVIPCHRVVGKKELTGFTGGIAVKQRLLSLEQRGENRDDRGKGIRRGV